MIRSLIFTLFFLLSFNSNPVQAQSAEEWFEKGNTAYTNAAYKQAIEAYGKALETGQHSAALYHNLGSSYYRLNQVAESIYYFEKGLLLAPNDPDLNNNILFAKNMTIDAIEELPQTQVKQFQNQLLATLSLQQWAGVTLILIWVFALLFTAYLWMQSTKAKKQLFVSSVVFGIVGIACFLITSKKNALLESEQYGIVFSEIIEVNNEPNNRSEIQFTLHEGTKVQIVDVFENWQKIRIANGAEGWVSGADIKAL